MDRITYINLRKEFKEDNASVIFNILLMKGIKMDSGTFTFKFGSYLQRKGLTPDLLVSWLDTHFHVTKVLSSQGRLLTLA